MQFKPLSFGLGQSIILFKTVPTKAWQLQNQLNHLFLIQTVQSSGASTYLLVLITRCWRTWSRIRFIWCQSSFSVTFFQFASLEKIYLNFFNYFHKINVLLLSSSRHGKSTFVDKTFSVIRRVGHKQGL